MRSIFAAAAFTMMTWGREISDIKANLLRWDQRTYDLIFQQTNHSSFFCYMPYGKAKLEDWQILLFDKLSEQNTAFVHSQKGDNARKLSVPRLRDIMKIEQAAEPRLFMYHHGLDKACRFVKMYPDTFDDINNFAPELIQLWAEVEAKQCANSLEAIRIDADEKMTKEIRKTSKEFLT